MRGKPLRNAGEARRSAGEGLHSAGEGLYSAGRLRLARERVCNAREGIIIPRESFLSGNIGEFVRLWIDLLRETDELQCGNLMFYKCLTYIQ